MHHHLRSFRLDSDQRVIVRSARGGRPLGTAPKAAAGRRRRRGVALLALGLALVAAGCRSESDVRLGVAGEAPAVDPAIAPERMHRSIEDAAAEITAERMRAGIAFLASDEMNGRHWKSDEGRRAAAWIAERMSAIGLEPGGADGGFFLDLPRHPGAAPNVVGVLRGSRPGAGVVLVTAHYDHLAPRHDAGPGEDAIYNGADDNASGVMGVLEAARAMAMLRTPPEGDVWFVAFSGEEAGLHGAKALAADPPVPVRSIRGLLNLDMISRSTPDLVCVDGLGAAPAVANAIIRANARVGRLDLRIDQHPDWLRRSDQAPFLALGVPSVLFSVEDHEDYHQVTDEVEKIDAELAARVARVVFVAAHHLAGGAD